jgi:hypothetical protein
VTDTLTNATALTIPASGNKWVDVPIDVPYGLYTICAETTSTSYGNAAYRWATFGSNSAGAPTGAYHALPTGLTPKAGAPANNTGQTTLSLARPTSVSTDQCA